MVVFVTYKYIYLFHGDIRLCVSGLELWLPRSSSLLLPFALNLLHAKPPTLHIYHSKHRRGVNVLLS